MKNARSDLPPLPRADGARDFEPEFVRARLAACETAAGRPLPRLAGAPVPALEAHGKVENFVGWAQVPVGVAGPLEVETSGGERSVFVPFATTEGAMVAAYARGMKLLRAAGGAWARVVGHGLTQHPMLLFADARSALAARDAIPASFEACATIVAGLTKHGRLLALEPRLVGRRVVCELTFATGDAIGINMAARATDAIAHELAQRTGAERYYVHGEDVEKRANAVALARGRGRDTVAEVRIPAAVLREILRVTPEDLVRIQRSYAVGFARLGTTNGLVQAANGLAAVYLACGQDVAYVTESATGFLDFECLPDGDLHASAHLPSLLVGTVGGGSGQGTAAECLDLLGVRKAGGADELAEILAATVLAGDLSLLASFCTHDFVEAHERLGRNRPQVPRP